jgi:hypothetical protein
LSGMFCILGIVVSLLAHRPALLSCSREPSHTKILNFKPA